MRESNKKADLATGNIPKLMLKMAIPTVVAQLVNLLYNIVDRIYIGHIEGIGTLALTGVGLCVPITMLVNAFASLAGSGGAPRAAIHMGKKDMEEAEKILGNCFTVLLIFAIVLTVVLSITIEPLLILFGASENTLPYAMEYLSIYVLGSLFVLVVLGMNPFLTTQGFTRFSMMTVVIGAVVNIILDPILIFGFGMGVRGAAIATIFSQAISAVWVLRFLTGKKTILKLKVKNMKLIKTTILPCLGLGVSGFVMLSTESLLNICFNSSLSGYGGDLAVGAMTIISSMNQLITLPIAGICQGCQPIISYNFGAGNKERVKKAFFSQLIVCAGYTILFWGAIMLFPEILAGIFTNDTVLLEYTSWAIRIYMACIFSFGFQGCCQQSFVALGQAKISLFMACLRKLILLIPLILTLPHFIKDQVFAVFLAEPVSDIIAATVTTSVFLIRFNKTLDKGK